MYDTKERQTDLARMVEYCTYTHLGNVPHIPPHHMHGNGNSGDKTCVTRSRGLGFRKV